MSNSHVQPTMGAILGEFNRRIDAGAVMRRERRLPEGECPYCDKHGGDSMMPPHAASLRCESGKRPHCTCNACY